jgi:hypothetical protein
MRMRTVSTLEKAMREEERTPTLAATAINWLA